MAIDKLRPSLRLWHEDDPRPPLATGVNAARVAHHLPRCSAFRASRARLTEESSRHGSVQSPRSMTMVYKCTHESETCCGYGARVTREATGRQLATRSRRRQANPFFGCRRYCASLTPSQWPLPPLLLQLQPIPSDDDQLAARRRLVFAGLVPCIRAATKVCAGVRAQQAIRLV
ncbi:hypothetical protein LX36DRAFT_347048 [Colletotrichum falcatum]|nr:hypothetical protein LX36DRAFT_347048 [Colletotrichum falcatum]